MSAAIIGLGPLEVWLTDPTVTEVMVNAADEIWVERCVGTTGPHYVGRLGPNVAAVIIERILSPISRRVDRSSPIVDARLVDGSRVCVVLPPVAIDGASITVRRFDKRGFDLSRFATLEVQHVVRDLVQGRSNVVVSGGTSTGKTSLLNSLAALVPADQRIITLEDTAELQLAAAHVLRLEARPASPDGVDEITLAALLRTALRMRPDRLVIGEIRGDEAFELVQALNTGHNGSLATIHANSAVEAIARLESLVVRGHATWPLAAVREQIHRSIDAVIHLDRDCNGRRGIVSVIELMPPEHEQRMRTLVSGDVVVARPTRRRR